MKRVNVVDIVGVRSGLSPLHLGGRCPRSRFDTKTVDSGVSPRNLSPKGLLPPTVKVVSLKPQDSPPDSTPTCKTQKVPLVPSTPQRTPVQGVVYGECTRVPHDTWLKMNIRMTERHVLYSLTFLRVPSFKVPSFLCTSHFHLSGSCP